MNEEKDPAATPEDAAPAPAAESTTVETLAPNLTAAPPPETTPEPPADPRRNRRLWPSLVAIIILLLLAAAAYGGWCGWQWYQHATQARQAHLQTLEHSITAARSQTHTLQQQLEGATQAAAQAHDLAGTLKKQLKGVQSRLHTLQQTVDGGRRGVQMAIVEQLLLQANDAAQVTHNSGTAAVALAAADRRLAALQDPRLFKLREALAEERSALAKVQEPDIDGTAIAISQMMGKLRQLPFRTAPHSLPQNPADAKDNAGSAWARGWDRITQSLKALFHVHHHNKEIQPLLSDAQRQLVGAVLALRLDGARAALIRRNTPLYQNQIESADHWLQRYYRKDSPAVNAMHKTLLKLAGIELSPPLPDISASLVLLRKQQQANNP